MNIELTDREVELIQNAIEFLRDERNRYADWIDDRPMLPAKEEAVQKVRDESRELLRLQLKFYDRKKIISQTG